MSFLEERRHGIRDDRSGREATERHAETPVDRTRRKFPAGTGKDQIFEESKSVDAFLTHEIPIVAMVDVLRAERNRFR